MPSGGLIIIICGEVDDDAYDDVDDDDDDDVDENYVKYLMVASLSSVVKSLQQNPARSDLWVKTIRH